MKLILTLLNRAFVPFSLVFLIISQTPSTAKAQICASPSTIIYGLTNNGDIYPINVTNGNVSTKINPAYSGNSPSQANSLGYNPVNGKFYYFKRNPSVSTQEFVCFDPGLMTYTILASAPTSNTFHTGCVSQDGKGYYAIDVNANIYYYDILLNTWTLITSIIKDISSNDVSSVIASRSSGDIAIDGSGNLWILCSSSSQYGLYKLSAPLPVTSKSSITVSMFLSPTTATPNGNSFAGIAFNPTGQLFLSTISDNKLYRMENNFSLTPLGTFTVSGVGNDLTSCSFPLGVLPVKWQSFTATYNNVNNYVQLDWTAACDQDFPTYYAEQSSDGKSWQEIGTIHSMSHAGITASETFKQYNPGAGTHQYRIKRIEPTGETTYSTVKTVIIKS
ncbi:MAG: hypothetical protein JSU05_15905, partial [Bacteroidetes bacterium]|nr:hypothetical protein [Bacteroidota bacterium]